MKTEKLESKEMPYMSYTTYNWLRCKIEQDRNVAEKEFLTSLGFLHNQELQMGELEPIRVVNYDTDCSKVSDIMHRNFMLREKFFGKMLDELKYAFKQGSHPNVKNSDFFGE